MGKEAQLWVHAGSGSGYGRDQHSLSVWPLHSLPGSAWLGVTEKRELGPGFMLTHLRLLS